MCYNNYDFGGEVVDFYKTLKEQDKEVYALIQEEKKRQNESLELIASENYVSKAVMEATGSIFTNKYAEGYPDKRYYGGCEVVDRMERLAIARVKQMFHMEHVNVQPHSGSSANLAVYQALLEPGDTVMGQSLKAGGHLTHGSSVNASGLLYNFVGYDVDENGFLDYDAIEKLAREVKPKLIVCGTSAYSRQIDFKRFGRIAGIVGAYLMVDISHIAGLIATGLHPAPYEYADVITTTTHKTLRGPRGGIIMCREGLANMIDKAVFPGTQGGPLEHVICAKAVALLEVGSQRFFDYQAKLVENAKALAAALQEEGIKIVTGGTDTHLMLIDLTDENITGKDATELLGRAHISVNKNSIPHDRRPPLTTSGIRIGTPAVTTRGMGVEEMKIIAHLLADIIKNKEQAIGRVREQVKELVKKFPIHEIDEDYL